MSDKFAGVFNNESRIGNDNCDTTQRNIQNVNQANWTLTNMMSNSCSMDKGIDFALSNGPGINFKGSHHVGIGGCQIDTNSNLLIEKSLRSVAKINLATRTFNTVPYLGRGGGDSILESQLQQGDLNTNKKSITNLTERSYMNYHTTPLVPSLAKSITDSSKCVESDASEGWVRGGEPSRDISKNHEYKSSYK